MSNISLSGAKTVAYKSTRGAEVIGDAAAPLLPNAWYEISAAATTGSVLPIGVVSAVFRTPEADTLLTPIAGDNVFPLTLTRVCKTDAEVTLEEGTIDVTDDCENGYNANILDGYKTIAGTLNGFMKFDDQTGKLADGTEEVFGRFFNIVTDDSAGTYTVTPATNDKLVLFILLNKDAGLADIQNWLIIPALLSGLGSGAGLKDAQKRDLTWTKAQGYTSLYQRTIAAGDL